MLKDGRINGVYSEGKFATRTLGELLRSLLGRRQRVESMMVDTSPIKLEFWLGDPASPPGDNRLNSFLLPALTKDKQVIGAQITLGVSIDPQAPELLLGMLKGNTLLTTSDLQDQVKHELLARVIQLELGKHNAEDLRGNDQLIRGLVAQAEIQLEGTLKGYGLRFHSFDISWAVTEEESQQLETRRHEYQIERAKREAEIDQINRTTNPNAEAKIVIGGNYRSDVHSGIGAPWLVLVLAVVLAGIVMIVKIS